MDREIRQPAGVSGTEGGAIVSVGHQIVQVLLGQHCLDLCPALRIFGRRDGGFGCRLQHRFILVIS
ncbi:MAG: hypothetical protein A2W35_09005 [Chloroflexi bacterium RBG_16_57_11]|nr:MAG: hypothetical protein A2W35_09005 [Chloroflexi bacterium RBG_16_57_11]